MAEDRAADNPPCNREELLARVVVVVKECKQFVGLSGQFAEALGPGSWVRSLNHLRRYLREIESKLAEHGIRCDFSDERLMVLEEMTASTGIGFPNVSSSDTFSEVL